MSTEQAGSGDDFHTHQLSLVHIHDFAIEISSPKTSAALVDKDR